MALISKELDDKIRSLEASLASLEESVALLEEALAPAGEDDGEIDDQEEEASQEG